MGIYKPGRPFRYVPASRKGTRPPEKPGIYRIRDPQGRILYIGETCNIRRRMHEHMRTGMISCDPKAPSMLEFKIADGRSTSRTRRLHEKQKIARHKPCRNRSGGGEGRIAAH